MIWEGYYHLYVSPASSLTSLVSRPVLSALITDFSPVGKTARQFERENPRLAMIESVK